MSSYNCAWCKRGPPQTTLKHCAKCSTTPYCSRDCQKAHWKVHKKECGKLVRNIDNDAAGTVRTRLSPPKGLDKPIAKPFTRLDNGTWLHDRPEADVYRLLVDAYRLYIQDSFTMEGNVDPNSIYGGAPDGLHGFQRFLCLVAARPKLLPRWWNSEKKAACEKLGMDPLNWSNLYKPISKADIIEHYEDRWFPMQLRMFAEAVYGHAPGGADGTPVRKMMVSMERGDKKYSHLTTIDTTTMNMSYHKV